MGDDDGGQMTTGDASPWLTRSRSSGATDDAGAVLRAWRTSNRENQTAVASLLGITQQNLSQIEKGTRPVSLELRRKLVELLGIAPEDLGLSSGQARSLIASDDASPEIASSRFQWRNQRRWLNQHRSDLARLAVNLYPAEYRVPRTPLISRPEWVAGELTELSTLNLMLSEQPHPAAVDGSEPETEPVRPLRVGTAHFERYTSVVKHLDPPTLFESRPSYRLLGADLATGKFEFGLAAYFDKLDVSEALGHELARACMESGIPADPVQLRGRLPFRDLIGDPFDPMRRAIIPAITTLTIRLRRYPAEPSFLLHWRDPAKVATAGGVYDVIPAGEFQPSSVALWDRRNDFDLWRNIVREYSEELLGEPEHDGTRTQPIDYDGWSLYRDLSQARQAGTVGAFFLGISMHALTLGADILTVVVIDDDLFEQVFGNAVRYNDEGEIVSVGGGTPAEGIPFTAECLDRIFSTEPIGATGRGLLTLAWKHRDQLLGF